MRFQVYIELTGDRTGLSVTYSLLGASVKVT